MRGLESSLFPSLYKMKGIRCDRCEKYLYKRPYHDLIIQWKESKKKEDFKLCHKCWQGLVSYLLNLETVMKGGKKKNG